MRGYAQLVSYCERISERYFGVAESLLPAAHMGGDADTDGDAALRSTEVCYFLSSPQSSLAIMAGIAIALTASVAKCDHIDAYCAMSLPPPPPPV